MSCSAKRTPSFTLRCVSRARKKIGLKANFIDDNAGEKRLWQMKRPQDRGTQFGGDRLELAHVRGSVAEHEVEGDSRISRRGSGGALRPDSREHD
jgi:hypothetical protein